MAMFALSVSTDAAGCVFPRAQRAPAARRSTSTPLIHTTRAACAPSEFLRGGASAPLFAAAAAPCRRARLGGAAGLDPSPLLSVRAGLGDYSSATAAAYGLTLLAGGLFAFVRTGSKGSLGGGLTGAALYGTTYYLLQSSATESLGNALGFGTGLLFAAVFAIRLFATGKPVPAGPLLGLSALATAVFASAYFA